jgi:3-oxoacyl-[acyl-carrier protein] reductase
MRFPARHPLRPGLRLERSCEPNPARNFLGGPAQQDVRLEHHQVNPGDGSCEIRVPQLIQVQPLKERGNDDDMKDSGLRNKVVLITGAGAGIGKATALRFAGEGARIAAFDVNDACAPALLSELKAAGGDASYHHVNVADSASVAAGVKAVIDLWGRIDVLVNNAGILRDAQLVKLKDGAVVSTMSDEAFDAVISVNLKGVFLCTRAVVPNMISGGGGVILSASSVVGLYGNFGQTNYVATKAGVIAMTRTWARELGRYNIRVNAVAPGFIATEMVQQMPEKVLQNMVARTPLGRMGTPEDVAETYAWLASDAASFITGTVISVDGGVVVGT